MSNNKMRFALIAGAAVVLAGVAYTFPSLTASDTAPATPAATSTAPAADAKPEAAPAPAATPAAPAATAPAEPAKTP